MAGVRPRLYCTGPVLSSPSGCLVADDTENLSVDAWVLGVDACVPHLPVLVTTGSERREDGIKNQQDVIDKERQTYL